MLAASKGLAELTKQAVPKEVLEAYNLKSLAFGPEYIIPKPFDPRLREFVAERVKQQALDDMKNGK